MSTSATMFTGVGGRFIFVSSNVNPKGYVYGVFKITKITVVAVNLSVNVHWHRRKIYFCLLQCKSKGALFMGSSKSSNSLLLLSTSASMFTGVRGRFIFVSSNVNPKGHCLWGLQNHQNHCCCCQPQHQCSLALEEDFFLSPPM